MRRRRWALAARLAVSGTLLWLVSRWVDAGDVLARVSDLRPGWAAAALAVSVLQVVVLAWRWRFTAARLGIELPFGTALAEYYLGILVNQLVPGGVAGDVSRAWRHARDAAAAGPVVRAVVLERVSAQVLMTTTAIVSILWLPWASAGVRVAVASGAAVVLVVVLTMLARAPAGGGDSMLGRLGADARRAVLAPDVVLIQFVSALAVVASYIVVFLLAAGAVGTPASLARMLPLVAPLLMTMLVPVTVAGWGIREAAAAALWGLAGLTPEDGAAISVAYGLLVLVSSGPGLFVLAISTLGSRGRRGRPPQD